MEKITKYKCSMCGREHDTEDAARKCETRCKCRYLRYCVRVVPHNGTFESSVLPVKNYTGKPEVEVYIGDDGEGHEQKTFNITVSTNAWTDDLVRKRLAAAVKAQLGCITDKLYELETMQ